MTHWASGRRCGPFSAPDLDPQPATPVHTALSPRVNLPWLQHTTPGSRPRPIGLGKPGSRPQPPGLSRPTLAVLMQAACVWPAAGRGPLARAGMARGPPRRCRTYHLATAAATAATLIVILHRLPLLPLQLPLLLPLL